METTSHNLPNETSGLPVVAAEVIRQARIDNPKMRERDLANYLNISEATFVAAWCGISSTRIEPRVNEVLGGLEALGEVMALTRNESAVHEKIGVYDKVHTSARGAIVLGEDIDLRIFHKHWVHGFAVEKKDGDNVKRSLQFFDEHGDAVHKVHLRSDSDIAAYDALVLQLRSENQRQDMDIATRVVEPAKIPSLDESQIAELRGKWAAMNDVHQFMGLLRHYDLTRHNAVSIIDDAFAWPLDRSAMAATLNLARSEEIPIMCFVGSTGCIQIHTGPIENIKPMGPWINIMDPKFHLHLRMDHIHELWAVRKPNKDGHVTSIEAYDSDQNLIIQFFGSRKEGTDERADWRLLVENLPRISRQVAI